MRMVTFTRSHRQKAASRYRIAQFKSFVTYDVSNLRLTVFYKTVYIDFTLSRALCKEADVFFVVQIALTDVFYH